MNVSSLRRHVLLIFVSSAAFGACSSAKGGSHAAAGRGGSGGSAAAAGNAGSGGGSGGFSEGCVEGTSVQCVCANGAFGLAMCNFTGSQFNACSCPSSDASGVVGADGGAAGVIGAAGTLGMGGTIGTSGASGTGGSGGAAVARTLNLGE
jgi:hypothetical protein